MGFQPAVLHAFDQLLEFLPLRFAEEGHAGAFNGPINEINIFEGKVFIVHDSSRPLDAPIKEIRKGLWT